MQLICHRVDDDAPELVPARPQRNWMDAFPHRHPYRCLPMTIANAYGWELLSPVDFEAEWNGGPHKTDIVIRSPKLAKATRLVSSHFARGVLTFHTGYLFQTDPSWELIVTGPANDPKDGIGCLTGVVETHWLPFPFTMNWQFTRPGTVRWSVGEPFCLVYPVARQAIEQTQPIIRSLNANPALKEHYVAWRDSRGEFLQGLRERNADVVKAGWQRHYFRGEQVADGTEVDDHLQKLRPATPKDETIPTNVDINKPPKRPSPHAKTQSSASSIAPLVIKSNDDNSATGSAKRQRLASFPIHYVGATVEEGVTAEALREASYLICTTPRSGSYLLSGGLRSTGVAGRPQEYFDAVFEPQWRNDLHIGRDDEFLPAIRTAGTTPNGVFGAKVLYFQFENLQKHLGAAYPQLLPESPEAISAAFGPTKFIWLRREDKTLQAISWFRAVKTDQWYDLTDESPLEPRTLEFDAAKIAEMKRTLENYDEQWRAYFERHQVSVFEIIYEDFAQEYEATIQRVLEFLAPAWLHKARTPASRLRRQADDVTFEWLHRFSQEMPAEYARTDLARSTSAGYNRAGVDHFRRGDFAAAETCLRRALEWDGLFAPALQNLGSALASLGKFEQAISCYHRALALSPENVEICRNVALTYERSGLLDDAERFYYRAAQLSPQSAELRRHLARLAIKRHRTMLQTPVLPRT